eukprot:7712700-Pyramimonas_sp.AAC.1
MRSADFVRRGSRVGPSSDMAPSTMAPSTMEEGALNILRFVACWWRGLLMEADGDPRPKPAEAQT